MLLSTDALVIVAKYPEPGRVKTRLGATLGYERSAALYRAFLLDLAERFTAAEHAGRFDLYWACPPGARPLGEVVGRSARIFAQRGDDFAERLRNISCDMHAAGYRRLVILGSDSPHVSAETVADAFAALDQSDISIGPAFDGGYYLIGLPLTPEPPDLFSGIVMSTATVYAETATRAAALGLTLTTLAPTSDVDEISDLSRLRALLAASNDGASPLCPRTFAALEALDIEQPILQSINGSSL
ncbi:MAG TPA: TIGR04282 family arsenosugar biosynthesis glycosyltransferase [Ktedonobacterales bacterium]|jgi:hypothetical protein|nr:TIGR04282 family arsenosugar biosynthesis glycosyltransferase [Ktedonobacterales bacterium]